MKVIPAIDIIEDKVTRLSEGKYETATFYSSSPLEQAKAFEASNFNRIHIVDLMGSKSGSISVENILKDIKTETNVTVQFGGGIRSIEDVDKLLDLGVDQIIIGSLSVNKFQTLEKMVDKHSPENFIIAADVKDEQITIKGWTENSGISVYEHINNCRTLGIQDYLCTDITKDGLLEGPSFELYKDILNNISGINLIASGGVSSIEDIEKLSQIGINSVVVGKAFYEGKIKLEELNQFA